MRVSIIIPTFNRAKLLGRAIESVLNQSFKEFELVIVDDGSTDKSEEVVRDFTDPRIIYLKIKNRGVSAARNEGIDFSTGEWIAFLDSDDEWLPHKLDAQLKFIDSNPSICLVHGEEIWVRNGKRVNPKNIHTKFGGEIFEKCLPLCLISPSAVIIKRDLLLEVGCFDEDYIVCEDYDLWLKITSKYEVGFLSDPIITKYGGHEDQLSAKFFAMDYWRVKSMDRILTIRDFKLERRKIVLNEIISKSEILLGGYKKHNNMKNYNEIETIYNNAKEEFDG